MVSIKPGTRQVTDVEPARRRVGLGLVQLRRTVPGGNDPLIDVLVGATRAHQLTQQLAHRPAAGDLRDHNRRRRSASRTTRWDRRVTASTPRSSARFTSTCCTTRATNSSTAHVSGAMAPVVFAWRAT